MKISTSIASIIGVALSLTAARADEDFTVVVTATVTNISQVNATNGFAWDSSITLGTLMQASFTYDVGLTPISEAGGAFVLYDNATSVEAASLTGSISVGDYTWAFGNQSLIISEPLNGHSQSGYELTAATGDMTSLFNTSVAAEFFSTDEMLANTDLPMEQLPLNVFNEDTTLAMAGYVPVTIGSDIDSIEGTITEYAVTENGVPVPEGTVTAYTVGENGENGSSVSDGGSTAAMLGLALMGFAFLCRKTVWLQRHLGDAMPVGVLG